MKPQTRVVHHQGVPLPQGNSPLVPPVYHSVKYTFERMAQMREAGIEGAFVYSRVSNPTVRQLEILLSELQGTELGFCVGSGVAAITSALIGLLQAGDHVIQFVESYKPTRFIIGDMLGKFGLTNSVPSLQHLEELDTHFRPGRTRLVIFESPTNPVTHIADIERITQWARAQGVITLMDNTFAGFHNHGDYPVDVYLHSLTKFASGHGDVMGGAVLGSAELVGKIRHYGREIGATLDPGAAATILRGMETYPLRYQRQCENALKIARFLEAHPRADKVRYPGLESHPGHQLAVKQMKDFGSVIAFDVAGARGGLEGVIDRLKLFPLAGSLGSTKSLIAPCLLFYGGDLNPDQLQLSGISEHTARLSVGIEDPADLITDLTQALDGGS